MEKTASVNAKNGENVSGSKRLKGKGHLLNHGKQVRTFKQYHL